VVPLAEAEGGTVLGSLSWRLDATGDPGDAPASASEATLVEVQRGGLFVRPLGTPAHVARRAAVEADLAGGDGAAEAVGFFSAAAVEAGGLPYTRGAHAESGLSLDQFLLLRVGPFADCWARLSADRVARGDTTAGLIAAERGSARNPGWGCCLLAQARMLSELRRLEEARDVALSALETPFWTFGAPVSEARGVAEMRPARSRGVTKVWPRCGRDAAEMQPRCSRDAAEMQPRCSRDVAEMQPRCSRDAAEM